MRTRDQAVKRTAMTLSLWSGFDWQLHPDARQQKRQDGLMRQADKIVAQIEEDAGTIHWKAPE